MNLPNKLTFARLLCVPLFLALMHFENPYILLGALIVFIGAGVTDLVDGYYARKYGLVTPLGVFMDPLADKLIVTAAFISFVEVSALHVPAWMVVLIVGREFLITGLRSLAASQGQIVPADDGGKFKTSVQVTSIITILVIWTIQAALQRFWGISVGESYFPSGWRLTAARILEWSPYWLVFIATLFSIVTGISYLRKHKTLLTKTA